MSIQSIKTEVLAKTSEAIAQSFGQRPEGLKLGFPPDIKLGDFTVGCFPLAKQFSMSPVEIAKKVAIRIVPNNVIAEAKAVGSYLNFRIVPVTLFGDVCAEIMKQGDSFGNSGAIAQGQKTMVEYLSPNTNKPLHLGHLRNGALGMAVSNLLEAIGHNVVKANLVNDRGVHICKSMLAWQKWANGASPESTGVKGDHFVGDWYIRYSQEAEKDVHLEEEVQQMLQKWEAGDPEIVRLWEMMNGWVYDGFGQTYQELKLKFDVFYYESETYKLGKDIIQEGLKKGVFSRTENGTVVVLLPESEFGVDEHGERKKVTVLRADGTSVYMTQDIGTAKLKFDEHGLDRSIYLVGSEQNYHFKCLFKILEMLGFEWAKGCYHLSYGMVYLPEGKMKSREGKVVDADDLIDGMVQLAAEEIRKRNPGSELSEAELNARASKIGLGAIKFYLLRVSPQQEIHFDPKESISFEGSTGPYCQYSYARAASIVRKANETTTSSADFSRLGNPEELLLIQKLIQFPDQVENAALELNPSRVSSQVYEIAKAFNQFYQKHSVLVAENEELIKARLALVKASMVVLKKGLALLGIEVVEEM